VHGRAEHRAAPTHASWSEERVIDRGGDRAVAVSLDLLVAAVCEAQLSLPVPTADPTRLLQVSQQQQCEYSMQFPRHELGAYLGLVRTRATGECTRAASVLPAPEGKEVLIRSLTR